MDWTVGLHPELVRRITLVLADMVTEGYPMRVCQGLRTTAQQQAAYAEGRTAPGRVVTNADGVHHKSNHQAQADGYGHAVDCCFLGSDPFGETQPWPRYGLHVEARGLHWGGSIDFKRHGLIDRPHAELPA